MHHMADEKPQPMEVNGSESAGADGGEIGAQNVKVSYQCFSGSLTKKQRKKQSSSQCLKYLNSVPVTYQMEALYMFPFLSQP